MSARVEARLWVVQRATAVVLAACVLVHLVTLVYAVRGGLSAEALLGRTRGHYGWGAFYAAFVLAASVHGAIGLRTIAREWLGWRRAAGGAAVAVALALAVLGLRAVAAVVLP
jgi:fumarate reductase subunit C